MPTQLNSKSISFKNLAVRGPGDYVHERYTQMLTGSASGLWHKIANMAGGSFLKGAIFAALATIAAMAIGGGIAAAAGTYVVNGPVLPTVEAGVAAGIGSAIGLLAGTPLGWLILGGGGIAGAAVKKFSVGHTLTPEAARQKARQYEQMREAGQAQQLQVPTGAQKDTAPAADQSNDVSEKSFRDCLCQERAQNMNMKNKQQEGTQGYGR